MDHCGYADWKDAYRNEWHNARLAIDTNKASAGLHQYQQYITKLNYKVMKTFEEFWNKNKQKYIDAARNDFDRFQKGNFVASVSIESDDDFDLDIGLDFQMYSDTISELRTMLIQKLTDAKLTRVCTWSIESATEKRNGDHSDCWFAIRDYAISRLKADSFSISYGGNQSIHIKISENLN